MQPRYTPSSTDLSDSPGAAHPMKFGISQSITRKEDAPLLRGAGRYAGDVMPSGTLHAVVLRSPHAHARFRITDTDTARALPGVRLVLTARDPAIAALGPMPCVAMPPGHTVEVPPYPVLARDQVMHVGDAVAFVVADTIEQAKDAAEAIAVAYEPLPHVVDAVAALGAGAPQVWPDKPGNVAFALTLGDERKTTDAFARAARTVELTVVNQRLVTNYMETRTALAEYDPATDGLTLTLGSQGAHLMR